MEKSVNNTVNTFHEKFKKTILDCGFKEKRIMYGYDYTLYDGTWFYHLDFEGYAYVLYKTISIYRKPLMNLFKFYNKFKKGEAQIHLYYDVPIAHFCDSEKFKIFIEILTGELNYETN